MKNYIKYIREKVGHDCIFLNFVGACIADEKGNILLQRRGDKNKWGFLGGAMELGESAKTAIIREVKEESGYDIIVDDLLGVYTDYTDSYPNGNIAQTIGIFFKCTIIGGSPYIDNVETLELKFFDPSSTPKLFNKQHQDVLNDFVNNQRGIIR